MNYEFKGTSGSWSDMINNNTCIDIVLDNHTNILVSRYDIYGAELVGTPEEMEANAHLISAAPELLQACIELEAILSPLTNNPAHASTMYRLYNAIHKALNISEQ